MKKVIILCLLFLLAPPAFALKIDDPAPAFSLVDREGKVFSLSDYVGTKRKEEARGVIVSFFASWCVPCRHELPIINAATAELNGNGVKVVLVASKEQFDVVRQMLTELKIDRPIVVSDGEGKVGRIYGIRFLPTTFFIGSNGAVKDISFGEIKDEAELRQSVKKMLK